MEEQNSAISTQFGEIVLDRIISGMSTSSDIALLKQTVTTVYPGARPNNDKVDALFGAESFGEGQSYESTRYALIKVPKNATEEQVKTQLDNYPNARLYRVLSTKVEDVLTSDQLAAIDNGISSKTIEEYKQDKEVKDADGNPVKFSGESQYRSIFFAVEAKEDIDMRVTPAPVRQTIATPEGAAINVEEAVSAGF